MNYIELFAGCGGLSLGLESAGFELVLANELSPMAAETYAYNLLNEDLSELSESNQKNTRTIWLSSKHKDLAKRLRENPFEYPELGSGESDIPKDPNELDGSLLVGNIIQINQFLLENPLYLEKLKNGFGRGEIDVVSGGPPCQSFSLAGLRKRDCDKNTLPWEFANFVELIQPKFSVLENVTGILRPFKENGISYYAWYEIAKVFASKGYIPVCLHINARLTGVPQNRPRFIMLGIREDTYKELRGNLNDDEKEICEPSYTFFKNIKNNKLEVFDSLSYFDVKKLTDLKLIENSFLAPLVNHQEVSVKDAIDDMRFTKPSRQSKFVKSLNQSFEAILGKAKKPENHEPRLNSDRVLRRFRIYQIMQLCSKETNKQVLSILKQESEILDEAAWGQLKVHKFISLGGGDTTFTSKSEFINFLRLHPTKKQTQRALDSKVPAPAALSIPDDACHYHHNEVRTLTVREMARIQSFPDNFVFRSKVTTGGKMRRFEVPQYTQVGNAVPPLLGFALGSALKNLNSILALEEDNTDSLYKKAS